MVGSAASDSFGAAEDVKDAAAVDAGRAEIDTSAPFESVKEAVDRFGGSAVWKSQLKQLFQPEKHHCPEDVEIVRVEEQAAQLEKDLFLKERETLDVLKELEMTKRIVDGLKLRIQKETNEIATMISSDIKVHLEADEYGPIGHEKNVYMDNPIVGMNRSPRVILMELKQATENFNKKISELDGIQTSIRMLNMKIEEEKLLLEKTREKLNANTSLISLLEEDLSQTSVKLQIAKDPETKKSEVPSNILQEIKEINSEMEQSRKKAETATCEVSKLTSEIEQTKASIKTAEIRWLAAKKMEEAAQAAEAMALADIKALTSSCGSSITDLQSTCGITLSVEEYMALTSQAQEADEISRKNIEAAMLQVDEANRSKSAMLAKVEEATAEAKKCRRMLEIALKRVEIANRGKLTVEDALRRWRSEHGQKRRSSVHNSIKFKSSVAHSRKNSRVLDLNDSVLITEDDVPVGGIRPPLSIGQILSMKLMSPQSPEEYDGGVWEKENEKPSKVSLGQMLNKGQGVSTSQSTDEGSPQKQLSAKKKKKLGFVGLPHLLAKQSKKNKKKKKQKALSAR